MNRYENTERYYLKRIAIVKFNTKLCNYFIALWYFLRNLKLLLTVIVVVAVIFKKPYPPILKPKKC